MTRFSEDFVRPLRFAEARFLQVLLSTFELRRVRGRVELHLEFDGESPAIWLPQARTHIRDRIKRFQEKARRYQSELDDFLIRGKGDRYRFNDRDFPFRFGSGGSLPVIRMGMRDYYCLFYRDIYPIGWNIANGGTDSREELLRPRGAIERELREELIVIEPKHGRHFVFREDVGKPLDHPDFHVARRIWERRFSAKRWRSLEEHPLPLKWIDGPDALHVRFNREAPAKTDGVFLNINASDFGIEVDRIAKIQVDQDVVLCDGELIDGKLVNEVVGLFEIEHFNQRLEAGASAFEPDIIFYGGKRYDGAHVENCIEQCLRELRDRRSSAEKREFTSTRERLDLCPVTRRLAMRAKTMFEVGARTHADADSAKAPWNVFISAAHEDDAIARQVLAHLKKDARLRVFYCTETRRTTKFGREIDNALVSASALVVVASRFHHIMKDWVEYEWRAFHQMMLARRKSERAGIVTVAPGIDPRTLPPPLLIHESIPMDGQSRRSAFEQLRRTVLACR